MHCKDVSVWRTDEPLTESGIASIMKGKNAYVRTEYTVLQNKDEFAVVKIIKEDTGELFEPIRSYEIVSLPNDTVFVKDDSADVLNAPAMALLQSEHPGKTIVVEGMFSHINFVSGLKTQRLRVIDNIPPSPSKLSVLVNIALASGYVDHPIIPEFTDIDMADRIKDVRTEAVMFPCRVSGMSADMPIYFLDDAPEIKHEITLIGCELSLRIFSTLYHKDVPFINVCPSSKVPDDDVKTIIKCCKIKNGHIRNGNTVMVPWGVTVPETVDAINDLFSE